MQKLKIDRLIIVEGKYDKIRLSNIVDADIIAVNGFSLYKDKALKSTLKKLAHDKGAIILTDSDTAGYKIRVYLTQILGNADVVNILAPQLKGKEKRKSQPSAQGYLGIEGTDDKVLYDILSKYVDNVELRTEITAADLYELGLSGTDGAKERKMSLARSLGVQEGISNKFLLRLLNEKYTKRQLYTELGATITENEND